MLRQRVISATVLIPALICIIWFAPFWLFTLIFGIIILLGVYEFYKIVRYIDIRPFVKVGLTVTAIFITYAYFIDHPNLNSSVNLLPSMGAAVALSYFVISYLHGIRKWPSATIVIRWLWTVAGIVYVGWLGSHFILIRTIGGRDIGWRWVMLALFATFAADTFAYFIGRAFGKHKMAPSISPGKTWEGAVGGFAAGLGATVLLAYILKPFKPFTIDWRLILLGCLIPVVALLGDLVESKFKRNIGVKDAGSVIPGHGGILDRLDSILFVVVVVYYYVIWVI